MTTNLDQIRTRIRKCLNLAEDDGAMEGEIDNALRFARRLMLKHGITEEEARADGEARDAHEIAADVEATEFDRVASTSTGGKLTTWERSLVWGVLELIGTVQWYRSGTCERRTAAGTIEYDAKGNPKRAVKLMFYGPAEDVRDAIALVAEWSETIVALARMKFGSVFRGPGRSYAEGFAIALYRKAEAIRAEEDKTAERLDTGGDLDIELLATGTDDQKALVLSDRGSALALRDSLTLAEAKKEAGKTWLEDEHGVKLHKAGGGGGGRHFGSAFSAGKADGSRQSFSHSRTPKLGG